MEFGVAEIKLSLPDAQPRTALRPGGRIELEGLTMRQIIQAVWDISMDELLANAPKWFTETKYSVIAKTSTAISGPAANPVVDIDDLKAMVRAFPPTARGIKKAPAPDQKDQRNAVLGRMVTVKNMTMAQFADDLQRMANGYIRVPVEDKTGCSTAGKPQSPQASH